MRVPMIGSLLVSFSLACGGAESTDLFTAGNDGGGTNADGGGTNKDGGGTNNDGGGTTDGGNNNDAGKDCKALQAQLDQLRSQATGCTNNGGACSKFIPDFCCELTVTDDNSPQAKAFEAAYNNFKNLCAPPTCPGTPCRADPSQICTPQSHCLQ